jgi:hypothetical protein
LHQKRKNKSIGSNRSACLGAVVWGLAALESGRASSQSKECPAVTMRPSRPTAAANVLRGRGSARTAPHRSGYFMASLASLAGM